MDANRLRRERRLQVSLVAFCYQMGGRQDRQTLGTSYVWNLMDLHTPCFHLSKPVPAAPPSPFKPLC